MVVVHCSVSSNWNAVKNLTSDFEMNWGSWPGHPKQATDINQRLVYADFETDVGIDSMATICSISMSSQIWNDYTNTVCDAHKTAVEKYLRSTRQGLVVRWQKKTHANVHGYETINVAVKFDRICSKRDHSTSFRSGFVMSVDIGHVIDNNFKLKISWACNNWRPYPCSDEYKDWYGSHKDRCSKNFDWSSGNAEVAAT